MSESLRKPSDWVSSLQLLSHVWFFETACTAAGQGLLSITNSRSLLKLMLVESVMPSNHGILYHPLSSHFQSFPTSGSFLISHLFPSGGQSIGTSASALPVTIQDWFSLGLTGWNSLQSKGLSRVFANTTVQKAFFMVQLSHTCMTIGKTIALTRRTCVSKVMSLLFNMLSRLVIFFFQGASVF